MIRLIGILLVIWGMVAQPLMASIPAPMTDSNAHSSVAADPHAMKHHGDQTAGQVSKAPCHKNFTGFCDNCDIDCVDGVCASSCGIGGAAVCQKTSVNPDLLASTLLAVSSGARINGLPARIFHPPKHT